MARYICAWKDAVSLCNNLLLGFYLNSRQPKYVTLSANRCSQGNYLIISCIDPLIENIARIFEHRVDRCYLHMVFLSGFLLETNFDEGLIKIPKFLLRQAR